MYVIPNEGLRFSEIQEEPEGAGPKSVLVIEDGDETDPGAVVKRARAEGTLTVENEGKHDEEETFYIVYANELTRVWTYDWHDLWAVLKIRARRLAREANQ